MSRYAVIALLTSSILGSTQAVALNTRTWISGKGADQAGCGPIASPCRTLQYAHDQTSSGGEIDVLDGAGYGAVAINKAISIVNEGAGVAGVLAPNDGTAITINAPTDATVILRGLTIEGANAGNVGISFYRAAKLSIEKCVVQNFDGVSAITGIGIWLRHLEGSPTIVVSETTLANNDNVGLLYKPDATTPARVTIDRVKAYNNRYGISVTTTNPALNNGMIHKISIVDTLASNNSVRGFEVIGQTGGSFYASVVTMIRCTATQNGVGFYLKNGVLYMNATVSRHNYQYPNGDLLTEGGYVYSDGNNSIEFASQTPTGTKQPY